MKAVYADTVGLLAVWNRSDQWHAAALAAFQAVVSNGTDFVTTSYVLLECGNSVARAPFRSDVDELRQELEAAGLLVHPTRRDWQEAWAAFRLGDSRDAGIVDHVSFVVMRRLGLTQAFTNDRHFAAAGFEVFF